MTMKILNSLYVREISIKQNNRCSEAMANIFPLILTKRITIIIGENGCGKSTLLESIAIKLGCNPEGGGRNFNFNTENTHSELHSILRISKGYIKEKDLFFYRAETFYNLNSAIRRLDNEPSLDAEIKSYYGGRDLHTMSHGEAMEALFTYRFKPNGIYILDEPEASLSPSMQLRFIIRISELAKSGAQFIIATHSPIIMSMPNCSLLLFENGRLNCTIAAETEAYCIYKAVINSNGDYLERITEPG